VEVTSVGIGARSIEIAVALMSGTAKYRAMKLLLVAALLLPLALHAQTPAELPCAKVDNSGLAADLAPMGGTLPLVAAARDLADGTEAARIAPAKPIVATLLPQSEVRFPAHVGHAVPAFAGALRLTIAQAGTYRVAISTSAWIDLARAGKTLDAGEHAHGPRCSIAHKIVAFALTPGDYALQLSDNPDARVTVTVLPPR